LKKILPLRVGIGFAEDVHQGDNDDDVVDALLMV
jgi:hypothetical protein